MKKKTFITIAKSCLVSFTLLSAVCVTASKILLENESVISNFFGATTFCMVVSNIAFWLTADMVWAIVEWIYKKIPGVS